eukprot:12021919-Ditylum_brightwellii.AAC.1
MPSDPGGCHPPPISKYSTSLEANREYYSDKTLAAFLTAPYSAGNSSKNLAALGIYLLCPVAGAT